MSVMWDNPATAGHLTSQSQGGGGQDSFTNLADQVISPLPAGVPSPTVDYGALADYLPDPSLPGAGDYVMADFLADPNRVPAGRACLNVRGSGLFVYEEVASIWDAQQPGQIANLNELNPPIKVTQVYNAPLSDPGGYAGQGAVANITVTPNGENQWTVTIKAGAANPNFPDNNPHAGTGPFQGKATIGLQAINPGSNSKVMVSAQIQNSDSANHKRPAAMHQRRRRCRDRRLEGKTIESGSLHLGDPNKLGSSFSVSADSSCSGFLQSTKQCPSPGPVGIRVARRSRSPTRPRRLLSR